MYIAIASAVVLVLVIALAGLLLWKRSRRPMELQVVTWRFPAAAGSPDVVFKHILQDQAAQGFILEPITDPGQMAGVILEENAKAKAKGELICFDERGDYTFPSGVKIHVRAARLVSAPAPGGSRA